MVTCTVCPRSNDPIYIVTYFKIGSQLLGHTVVNSKLHLELRLPVSNGNPASNIVESFREYAG